MSHTEAATSWKPSEPDELQFPFFEDQELKDQQQAPQLEKVSEMELLLAVKLRCIRCFTCQYTTYEGDVVLSIEPEGEICCALCNESVSPPSQRSSSDGSIELDESLIVSNNCLHEIVDEQETITS